MFGGWLTDVYAAARDAWTLSDDDLADLARSAADASFADEDRTAALRAAIDAWLAAPVAPAHEPAVP
jgi:adenosine deaminase